MWNLRLLRPDSGVLGKAPGRFINNSKVGLFSVPGDILAVTAESDLLTPCKPASTCASSSESE